jgi:hypothetical protein
MTVSLSIFSIPQDPFESIKAVKCNDSSIHIAERHFSVCLYYLFCSLKRSFWCRLSTVSMERPGLAQSADKQVLFARLGLNEHIHKLLLVGFLNPILIFFR